MLGVLFHCLIVHVVRLGILGIHYVDMISLLYFLSLSLKKKSKNFGFQPGLTQTCLYSQEEEGLYFPFRKKQRR